MGSRSDWDDHEARLRRHSTPSACPYEVQVVSAHRTPDRLFEYASEAEGKRDSSVIIAGAGGAAHLPGMVASKTDASGPGRAGSSHARYKGLDSLLVDRADAGRSARGDLGHRGCGRNQRRDCWRAGCLASTIPKSGKPSVPTPARAPRLCSPTGPAKAASGRTVTPRFDPGSRTSSAVRVGILGGGQLGRMLALEGIPAGPPLHHFWNRRRIRPPARSAR